MNTFRNSLKTQSLIGLKNLLTDGSYYVFIGKTTEWPDSTPSEVIDTVSEDSEIKRNLISAYKITSEDVRLVVEKNSWESGKIYSQYTDKENTDSKNYYVSTTSNDASGTTLIWVCVSNNNESQTIDSPSATGNVDPDSGQIIYSIGSQSVTSDGYIWELIFQTVGVGDADSYIPIDYTYNDPFTKILAINVIGNKSFDWAVNVSYSSEYTVSSIDTTQSPDQLYLSKSGLSSSEINNTAGYYANWFLILKNPDTGLIANISKISTSEYTIGSGFKITTCDNTLENSGINYTGYIYSIVPGLKTNYVLDKMYPVLDETTKAITSVEILNFTEVFIINEPIEITVQDKDGDVEDYTFDTIVSIRSGLGYSVLDTLKCNLLRITKSISAQGLKLEDKDPETLTIGSPGYSPSTNKIYQFGVIKTESEDPLTSNPLDKFSACDLLYTTRSSPTTTALDINDYVCQVVDGVITGYGQVISITDRTGQTNKPILTVLTLYKTFSTSNGVLKLLNITDLTTSTLTPSFTVDSITGIQYIKQSGRIIYVENIPGTYITTDISLDTKVIISL